MRKYFFSAACFFFPGRVGDFVYHKMTHPRVMSLRPHEISVLEQATKEEVRIGRFTIQTYSWKGGPDWVLLVHGWEGHAGNFAYLVEVLLSRGYSIFAFDGPAHGRSSREAVTFFDFSAVVGELLRRQAVAKVLCHSFGSVATLYALYRNRQLCVDKLVLLTAPNRLMEAIEDAQSKFSLTNAVCRRVVQRIQKETGFDLETLSVAGFVKTVNVQNALIIHDKNDAVLPIARSRAICRVWPACRLMEVEGTGHFRILRAPEVLDALYSFFERSSAIHS